MVYAVTALALLASCRSTLSEAYAAATALGNGMVHAFAPPAAPPPHDVEIINARESFVYLVPVEGGAVLIDSGFDPEARAVREALAGREVLAVLLTHGHVDHTEGAAALDAPTWLGEADHPVLLGERHLRCLMSHVGQHVLGNSAAPRDLRPARDGEVLELGGETFRAVATPGHTPGSTTWVWRELAFTGDAIVNATGFALAPSPGTTEEPLEAWRSLRRLAREAPEVRVLYDAHYGRTDDAQRALRVALDSHHGRPPHRLPR